MTIQVIKPMPTPPATQSPAGESQPEQGDFFDLIQQAVSGQPNSNPVNNKDLSKISTDKSSKPSKHEHKEHKALDLMALTEQSLANNAMLQTTLTPDLRHSEEQEINPMTQPNVKSQLNPQTQIQAQFQTQLQSELQPQISQQALSQSKGLPKVEKISQSSKAEQSVQPVQPVQPSRPIQPTQPIKPIQPIRITELAQEAQSIQSTQPTQTIMPAQSQQAQSLVNRGGDFKSLLPTNSFTKINASSNSKTEHSSISQTESVKTEGDQKDIKPSQDTQVFQAVQSTSQNNATMSDQQSKIAQSFSALGNMIQSQISATLPNQTPLTVNHLAVDTNSTVDNVAQAKKYDYEMSLEMPSDATDAHLKDAYTANIKIYPPELGNVLAKLKLDKTSAQLVIVTENDRVKNIVEANIPQLREHFQQSNLTLTHIQVQTTSSGSGGQNTGKQQQFAELLSEPGSRAGSGNGQTAQSTKDPQKSGNKIIDTYA